MINSIEEARRMKIACGPDEYPPCERNYESQGYIQCYETDPHVRALVLAAKKVRTAPIDTCGDGQGGMEGHHESCPMFKLEAALRPFEKEEKL